MTGPGIDDRKRAAAVAAVAEIEGGMLIGLGTGSTAAYAIAELGMRVRDGLEVRTVATSLATARAAREAGIEVVSFDDIAEIDLAIDGVDEIDGTLRAIKGAGGAMLREKIVATSARRMIAIADDSKQVERLGSRPVPVEVLPFARSFVAARLAEIGADVLLRMAAEKPYRTDQQNLVIDCRFGAEMELAQVASDLSHLPGVLGHGLFLDEIDALYVGTAGGTRRYERPLRPAAKRF